MPQIQLNDTMSLSDDLNELLDLVVTTKGNANDSVARIASSCTTSSTCCHSIFAE